MAAAVYAQQQAHAALLRKQQQLGGCVVGSPSGGSAGSGGGPPSAEPRAPPLVRPGKDAGSADSPGGTPSSPLSKQRGTAARQPAADRRRSVRQPKRAATGEAAGSAVRRAKKQQQPAASDGDGTHGSHASGTQAGAQQQLQGLPPLTLPFTGPGAGAAAALPIDLPDLDGLGDLDDLPGLDDLLIDEALQGAPLSMADPWASADPWAHLSATLPSPTLPQPSAPSAPPLLPPAAQPQPPTQPLSLQQAVAPGGTTTFPAHMQQPARPMFVPQEQPGMGPRNASADAVRSFGGHMPAPAAMAAAGPAVPLAALQAIDKPGQLSKRSDSARALLAAALSARLRRMQQQQAAVAAERAVYAAPPPAIPPAPHVAPVVPAAAAVTRPQFAAGPVFSGPVCGEAQLMLNRQSSAPAARQQAPTGQLLVQDPYSMQPVKRGTLRPPRPAFDAAALQLSAAAPLVAAGRAPGSPEAADLLLLRCIFSSACHSPGSSFA